MSGRFASGLIASPRFSRMTIPGFRTARRDKKITQPMATIKPTCRPHNPGSPETE
jgi:hypothetical protein